MSETGGQLNQHVYPPPVPDIRDETLGIYPVDFILEVILEAGIKWFRETSGSANQVFGHLTQPFLATRYGQPKINEIDNFIKTKEIRIVQHFSLIDATVPSISIQLLEATEREDRAGLDDHAANVDTLDDATGAVLGREQMGYSPISDNMHIGIHTIDTPDLTKYLYYLVIYILMAFKPQLEDKGLQLSTFRSTDISKLNEFLPDNMYSRFINFSVYTHATFKKDVSIPLIEDIVGVTVTKEDDGVADDINGGIRVADIE